MEVEIPEAGMGSNILFVVFAKEVVDLLVTGAIERKADRAWSLLDPFQTPSLRGFTALIQVIRWNDMIIFHSSDKDPSIQHSTVVHRSLIVLPSSTNRWWSS